MLVALDRGERLLADHARRGAQYHCPGCGAPVVLKAGEIVVHHFAHEPGSLCGYGTGESGRHMRMKHNLLLWFDGVELECCVVKGHRADAVVTTPKGNRFVVECQVSPISTYEWRRRTSDYNRAGFPVLWLWDMDRINFTQGRMGEASVPAELRECHDEYGSHIYAVDHQQKLLELRMEPVYRGEWLDEERVRLKEVRWRHVEPTAESGRGQLQAWRWQFIRTEGNNGLDLLSLRCEEVSPPTQVALAFA